MITEIGPNRFRVNEGRADGDPYHLAHAVRVTEHNPTVVVASYEGSDTPEAREEIRRHVASWTSDAVWPGARLYIQFLPGLDRCEEECVLES